MCNEYCSMKYKPYKLLKYFIACDNFDIVKALTLSDLSDFFYLGDNSSFNLALKLKNVSVVREYLLNFMSKNDIGSINMIYDCIKYIILKNSGDDRDE